MRHAPVDSDDRESDVNERRPLLQNDVRNDTEDTE